MHKMITVNEWLAVDMLRGLFKNQLIRLAVLGVVVYR